MAYPVLNGPYGFRPINEIGGLPYAGSTRMIPIAQNYTTNLYYGDPVRITTTGTVIQSTLAYNSAAPEGTTVGTVGIFLGCEYSVPGAVIQGKNRYQAWLGASNGAANITDAVAYVCDDPSTLFKVAMLAYTTGASVGLAAGSPYLLGSNVSSVLASTANDGTTGNLVGNSKIGVMASSTNGRLNTTAPFRIVQMVPETAVTTSAIIAATASSTTQTITVANTSILPGMIISGTGVTAGTFVQSVSGTSITASGTITGVAGNTLSFTGFAEVIVKFNQGYHAYQLATSA
jgi:hypothetical protein